MTRGKIKHMDKFIFLSQNQRDANMDVTVLVYKSSGAIVRDVCARKQISLAAHGHNI